MPVPFDYQQRVKALRRSMGLKQPEFAGLVGVSPITISRWENGQNDPTELAWARIAELEGWELPVAGTVWQAEGSRPQLDFGADPEAVAAVAETARLPYGHLASPTFATEISLIDPLPHQRVAVYERILKSWPIRFLLADDAGAGKTIITGLAIRELLLLRHIFRVARVVLRGALQQGHRARVAARATIRYRRTVAIEFATCRSGRTGGSVGLMILGNARRRELIGDPAGG